MTRRRLPYRHTMPEPQDNNAGGDLDGRVGTLLHEALNAARRAEDSLEATDVTPAPEPLTADSSRNGDAVAARPGVDRSPSPPAPDDVGQLDDDLARLTESLIASEAIDPGGSAARSAVPEPSDLRPGATVSPPPPPAPPVRPEPSSTAAPPPARTEPMQSGPATSPAPSPPPAAIAPPVTPVATVAPEPTKPDAARPLAKVIAGAAPVALSGLATVSAPLLKQPRIVRDTLGWIALWTIFLAACVWVYALFVHKPAPPESAREAIELVTEERPPAPPKADEHGAGSDGAPAHDAPKPADGGHH